MVINMPAPMALVVVDVQKGEDAGTPGIQTTSGRGERTARIIELVGIARRHGVPVVFIQEVHKPSLVDIGRELDGSEGPHAIEGEGATELADGLDPQPEEFLIRKRRYSAFFATELDLVLRSYGTKTVLLVGGLTDVCIHYTAVDAHQHDYFVRVAVDGVGGSSIRAHEAALEAIKYLQRDALVTVDDMARAMAETSAAAPA